MTFPALFFIIHMKAKKKHALGKIEDKIDDDAEVEKQSYK